MAWRPPTSAHQEERNIAYPPTSSEDYGMANKLLPSPSSPPGHTLYMKTNPYPTLPPQEPTQPTTGWRPAWGSVDSAWSDGSYRTQPVNQQPPASLSHPLPPAPYQHIMTAPGALRLRVSYPRVLEPTPEEQYPKFDPFAPRGTSGHRAPSSPTETRISRNATTSIGGNPRVRLSRPMPESGSPVPSEQTEDRISRLNLTIRQQPTAARACGMGNGDRRVVDPPPIIHLSLQDFNPRSQGDVDALRNPYNVMHCSLLDCSGSDVTQAGDTRDPERMVRGLTGSLMASPFCGTDPSLPASSLENARLGCFFLFPDLSVRQVGRYRLHFTLMRQVLEALPVGSTTPVLGVIESDIFDVFAAKDFPGMQPSTPLMNDLKRQGASVSVRKGTGKGRGQKRGSSMSGEEASEKSKDASTRRMRR